MISAIQSFGSKTRSVSRADAMRLNCNPRRYGVPLNYWNTLMSM